MKELALFLVGVAVGLVIRLCLVHVERRRVKHIKPWHRSTPEVEAMLDREAELSKGVTELSDLDGEKR